MGSDYEIEKLSGEEAEEYPEKVEITDSRVLAYINDSIRPLLRTKKSIFGILNNSQGQLFRVKIPKGQELIEAKGKSGFFRGLFKSADKGSKINDHALLSPEKVNNAAQMTAAVMNVASLIVGQYNLSQINTKLEEISLGVNRIEGFLEDEYGGKIDALIAQIIIISKYQFDIVEKPELRKETLSSLRDHEQKCIELLGQANKAIRRYANRDYKNYDDYRDTLYEAQNWFDFRKSLYSVLYKIEELRYTFGLGELSREFCFEIMNSYKNQIEAVQEKVVKWHQKAIKDYGIDFEKHRRRRDGWDAAFKWLPGLFDDDSNYKNMMQKTLDLINGQQEPFVSEQIVAIDTYNEDVQLIIDEEKAYYVPKKAVLVEA